MLAVTTSNAFIRLCLSECCIAMVALVYRSQKNLAYYDAGPLVLFFKFSTIVSVFL